MGDRSESTSASNLWHYKSLSNQTEHHILEIFLISNYVEQICQLFSKQVEILIVITYAELSKILHVPHSDGAKHFNKWEIKPKDTGMYR